MASQPTAAVSTTSQPAPKTSATTSKPEVSLPSSSHLDPGAYVRGSHPITIGQNVLIHPRVYLLSIHSPLIIGDGCIIGEKSVLGGPAPPPSGSASSASERPELTRNVGTLQGEQTRPTLIEAHVHLHANVTVNHGAEIKSAAVVESNSIIGSNATVGQRSKVAANLTVAGDVPDWTVIWGSNGDLKRRNRKVQHENAASNAAEATDNERLKAMDREREGTIAILKVAAARTLTSGQRKR